MTYIAQCGICGEKVKFKSQEEYESTVGDWGPEFECSDCREDWGPEDV